MDGQSVDQNAYIDNAIRAVQNKRQIPEIDFTLHTMEDGTQVSTQERVCKGCLPLHQSYCVDFIAIIAHGSGVLKIRNRHR
jgi:hypothetical protein